MQRGFMQRICRKRGPDVWQFRWSENGPDGKRTHHKKVVGTVEQFADKHSARRTVVGLITEINADLGIANSRVITIADLVIISSNVNLQNRTSGAPRDEEDLPSLLESVDTPSLAAIYAQ